jgi:hypothetical protein
LLSIATLCHYTKGGFWSEEKFCAAWVHDLENLNYQFPAAVVPAPPNVAASEDVADARLAGECGSDATLGLREWIHARDEVLNDEVLNDAVLNDAVLNDEALNDEVLNKKATGAADLGGSEDTDAVATAQQTPRADLERVDLYIMVNTVFPGADMVQNETREMYAPYFRWGGAGYPRVHTVDPDVLTTLEH